MLPLPLLLSTLPLLHLTSSTHLQRRTPAAQETTSSSAPSCQNSTAPPTFYLVTTSTATPSTNSSLLPNVRTTSFYDPTQAPTLQLRTTGPGYDSTPHFTLVAGSLLAYNPDPFGRGNYSWASAAAAVGAPLLFAQGASGGGGLSLGGPAENVLTVGGNASWALCADEFGESVVVWGGSGAGCVVTFLQAVASPPY